MPCQSVLRPVTWWPGAFLVEGREGSAMMVLTAPMVRASSEMESR